MATSTFDKILGLSKDDIAQLGYGIMPRQAKFILDQVDDEMCQVEWATGRRRRVYDWA
jgi:hypothetical protein